ARLPRARCPECSDAANGRDVNTHPNRAPMFLASYPEIPVTRSNQECAMLSRRPCRPHPVRPQAVRLPLQFPSVKPMSLLFRPCVSLPQRNQKSRLLDKDHAVAIVPNDVVSASHLFFERQL